MNTQEDGQRHILVVDDDVRIRTLLQKFLTDNNYLVTTAADAAEARAKLRSFDFDLLILDVMMPGESGFDLTKSLRETSQVPILLLTARGEAESRIEGLERGADDYLAKPFEPRELLLRIASIVRRTFKPEMPAIREVRMGACTFDLARNELVANGRHLKITSGEAALLRVLALNAGKPVSRAELMAKSGATMERSVDVQMTRLRRKIETDPRLPIYLQTVRSVGYVLVPDGVA